MAYTYDTKHNSPNFTPASQAKAVFGMPRTIEGFTLHWWGDPSTKPSYEGVRDYLCRKNGNTSAHIVVTGTGRRAACIVNYSDVAWHSGSAWGNAKTIGIELDPRNRPEDRDVFAEVLADLRSAFGDKPLYWHSYFINTECPGAYKALVDELDKLSYTKYSATQWGKGGNKSDLNKPKPAPKPTEEEKPVSPEAPKEDTTTPPVVPVPNPEQQAPSPTTKGSDGEPLVDTGLPVTSKVDFKDYSWVIKLINYIVQSILTCFKK